VQLGEVMVVGGDTPVLGLRLFRAHPWPPKCWTTSAARR
jgi:hypothetical protein